MPYSPHQQPRSPDSVTAHRIAAALALRSAWLQWGQAKANAEAVLGRADAQYLLDQWSIGHLRRDVHNGKRRKKRTCLESS